MCGNYIRSVFPFSFIGLLNYILLLFFCCCCCAAEKPILHSKSKTISYVRYGRLLDVVVVKQCIPMLTPIWPSNRASTTDVGLCLFECVFFLFLVSVGVIHFTSGQMVLSPRFIASYFNIFFIIVMSHFWLLAFTIISDFEYCVWHTQSKLVMQNEVVFGRRKFFFSAFRRRLHIFEGYTCDWISIECIASPVYLCYVYQLKIGKFGDDYITISINNRAPHNGLQ